MGELLTRCEDWEPRFLRQIELARTRPFSTKEWNCARFAHQTAEAVSGRKIPFVWKGSLASSADAALTRIQPRAALRGDVVLANIPEPSLGVCLGRTAAFVGISGLMEIPMSEVVLAWSV